MVLLGFGTARPFISCRRRSPNPLFPMPSQQEQPSQQQPPAQPPPRSSPATLVLGGAAACVALITAATAPFLAPGLLRSFGVPFNPTESLKLRAMLRHLPQPRRRLIGRGRPPAALVDLGSVRTARSMDPLHPTPPSLAATG